MDFRIATEEDIPFIQSVIDDAKKFFLNHHISQWEGSYPSINEIIKDIQAKEGYLILNEGEAIGYFALSFEGEDSYRELFDGTWTLDDAYAVIHRLCILSSYKGKGLSKQCFKQIELLVLEHQFHYIRVDTHPDNFIMQNLLDKIGYHQVGLLHPSYGGEYLAYDKVLTKENEESIA